MKCATLIKTVILFTSFVFFGTLAKAAPTTQTYAYYGEQFYNDLKSGMSGVDLQASLKNVLKTYHVVQTGGYDLLVGGCEGAGANKCYRHTAFGYGNARVWLMGNFYLSADGNGYKVRDVYCNRDKVASEFSENGKPAPNRVPDNTVLNVEHTWPQSHFTGKYSNDLQKSDLHHLFPTDSEMNGIRGNHKFGEVTKDFKILKCKESRYGTGSAGNEDIFEPPTNHKGNVARALFYFSTRYDVRIDSNEEVILRKWDKEDPVDAEEIRRNNEIFNVQGDRNPFVDYPELTDKILDF
jgi:endonuclease I